MQSLHFDRVTSQSDTNSLKSLLLPMPQLKAMAAMLHRDESDVSVFVVKPLMRCVGCAKGVAGGLRLTDARAGSVSLETQVDFSSHLAWRTVAAVPHGPQCLTSLHCTWTPPLRGFSCSSPTSVRRVDWVQAVHTQRHRHHTWIPQGIHSSLCPHAHPHFGKYCAVQGRVCQRGDLRLHMKSDSATSPLLFTSCLNLSLTAKNFKLTPGTAA